MSDEQGPTGLDLGAILGQVMDQARAVKGRMDAAQEKVKALTAEGGAGGGLVKVTATGDGRIKAIRIDPQAVDRKDVEMLEDLLVAGVNDALRRASDAARQELGQVTAGMDMGQALGGLGGLFGPGR